MFYIERQSQPEELGFTGLTYKIPPRFGDGSDTPKLYHFNLEMSLFCHSERSEESRAVRSFAKFIRSEGSAAKDSGMSSSTAKEWQWAQVQLREWYY